MTKGFIHANNNGCASERVARDATGDCALSIPLYSERLRLPVQVSPVICRNTQITLQSRGLPCGLVVVFEGPRVESWLHCEGHLVQKLVPSL